MSHPRRIQWREIGCTLLLILILGLALIFAWLTANPEYFTVVEGLYDWPWVGQPLENWVSRYDLPEPMQGDGLPQTTSFLNPKNPSSKIEVSSLDREIAPQIFLPQGKAFYEEPRENSTILGRTSKIEQRPWHERKGWWFRVAWKQTHAWVHLPEYADRSNPPLGNQPQVPGPRPSRAPELSLLADAGRQLQRPYTKGRLGPYTFIADSVEASIMEEYNDALSNLITTYSRWVVPPKGQFEERIVIFGNRESYENYKATLPGLENLDAPGFVYSGLVVIWTQGEPVARETLLHEVTHLLTRQTLGAFLPPWLDEGLADFFGESRFNGKESDPRHLSSYRKDLGGGRYEVSGGEASLMRARALAQDLNRWSVQDLLALNWVEFVESEDALDHYSLSHLFVRYLFLEHESQFRTWLLGLPKGEGATHSRLRQTLKVSSGQLEAEFRLWLRREKLAESED